MQSERVLYKVDQLPIFQNRMYDTEAEAKTCPKGDVRLVESLKTGLKKFGTVYEKELHVMGDSRVVKPSMYSKSIR